MHKWLRVLICMLLIGCILVNLSPLKADATAAGLAGTIVGASTVTVSAPLLIGAALISLGVAAGTNDDFQNVVSGAVTAAGDWVKDGTVELLKTVDNFGHSIFYASGEFLESLRSYCFNSGVLSSSVPALYWPANTKINFGTQYRIFSEPVYVFFYDRLSYSDTLYFVCAIPGVPMTVSMLSTSTLTNWDTYGYCWTFVTSGFSTSVLQELGVPTVIEPSRNYGTKIVGDFTSGCLTDITSSYDLTLGQISTVPIDGTSARSWASDEVADRNGLYVKYNNDPEPPDDNNGKWFWRLALPTTAAALLAMSQADEWSGVTPPEFGDYETQNDFEILDTPEIDGYQGIELAPLPGSSPGTGGSPDTGGDSDPDSGGDSNPDSGSESDPDADPDSDPDADPDADPDGSDTSGGSWKPPSDHNQFALLDLSRFFPFCIPFDLYDFFQLLRAEPVAPVLSWQIQDLSGRTYSLDVDLAQWDSVALLFRRLQLFLFITGLAAASRKFIKW